MRMPRPTRTFRECRALRSHPRERSWTSMVAAIAQPASRVRGSNIGVHDVGEEIGEQHEDRDHEEDPLHQRVVLVCDGLEEHVADARVGEDDLSQDRAAHDEAEREGEPGHVRQDGVARRVGQGDPAPRQPLGLGQQHVVLAEGRHHDVAHAEQPAGDRAHDDRDRRQDGVVDGALDEATTSKPTLTFGS